MIPTGRQMTLTYGDQRAVVTEVGANLRCYDVAGAPVVVSFDVEEMPRSSWNQVCYPWINRIGAGPWSFSGRSALARVDNFVQQTANHGLARWRPFSVDVVDDDRCVLSLVLHPSPDYPFLTRLEVTYSLGESGLSVATRVENLDDVAVPFSLGFHPYFALSTSDVAGATLHVAAEEIVEVDERQLPTGARHQVLGGEFDFRRPTRVDDRVLDLTYGDLVRDDDGWFGVEIVDVNGLRTRVRQDRSFGYVQLFTGDTLAEHQRRRCIAIEPMTSPANALRSGDDLVVLAPGATWSGLWQCQRLS